jgi:hypothetical protein
MAMSTRIVRRKPRCSTTWGREICQTSSTGKVDLNLMQAQPFQIRFRFVYNWRTSWTSKLRSTGHHHQVQSHRQGVGEHQ